MSYESQAKEVLNKIDRRFKDVENRTKALEQQRETMITYVEILKAEYKYLGSLQRGQAALYEALRHELPTLEQRYLAEATRVLGRDYPGTAENIQQLDAILERLKKS